MTMEQLLYMVSFIAKCLLPVLGVVLLVYIILFVKELIITLKEVTKTLSTVDEQVKKLDAPLKTAEDLSHTLTSCTKEQNRHVKK